MAYDSRFPNGYRVETGVLHIEAPHRRDGKKAFTWSFKAAGSDVEVPVEVFLVREPQQPLQFKAVCGTLPSALVDSDINRLHEAVEQALQDQAGKLTGIEWQDWFEVIVDGANSDFTDSRYSALGANLHIQVNRLKRGLDPRSGRVLTINSNGVVVPFPKASSLAKEDARAGSGLRLDDGSKERSYIPATAENRRALDELLERMSSLREGLARLLSQESVQDRLAGLAERLPRLEDSATTKRGQVESGTSEE